VTGLKFLYKSIQTQYKDTDQKAHQQSRGLQFSQEEKNHKLKINTKERVE
jgi:hypothetical protein